MTEVNGQRKPLSRKYYCERYTEKPWGMEKYQFTRIYLGLAHLFGGIGLFKLYTLQFPILIPFSFFYGYLAGAGITMGAHRYWTHKSFKAKLPLQILLAYMQTAAAQFSIFKWCRDHRIHHKYVDTESDPHNSRKGFWHSHIGWLLVPEPPGYNEKKDTIDFSDLDNDPIVRFQAKYYWHLLAITTFIVPMTVISYLVPGISWFDLYCMNYCWYLHTLHFTFLVNSAAHMWGYRPYEKWHNYHHTFPYDYKAAEIGFYKHNWSTMFIDFFAWIGWAYDLKSIPWNVVKDRVKRTGDGSHKVYGTSKKNDDQDTEVKQVWGWGDEDMTEEDYKLAQIYKPSPNPAG